MNFTPKENKQNSKSKAAADSPHYQQPNIASAIPQKMNLSSELPKQSQKDEEEERKRLEFNNNNPYQFAEGATPNNPNEPGAASPPPFQLPNGNGNNNSKPKIIPFDFSKYSKAPTQRKVEPFDFSKYEKAPTPKKVVPFDLSPYRKAPAIKREVTPYQLPRVQAKLKMGNPNDAYEREADKMADNFVHKQPTEPIVSATKNQVQQRKNEDNPKASQSILDEHLAAAISATMVGGQALPESTKAEMEGHFNADLNSVRIHTGSDAIRLCNAIGAKAFTYLNHIFFNEKMYAPTTKAGKRLLVHELTHTIQQRAIIQRKMVQHHTGNPMVQLFPGAGTIDGWAENVPGYKLIKVILGKSPITGDEVARTPENFIGGFMALLPGGNLLFNKLKESGALADTMTWLQQQVSELGITWAYVKGLIGRIWDQVSIWNGISGNKQVISNILTPPYTRIKNFVGNIATKVKELILKGALKLVGAPVDMVMGVLNKGKEVFAKILEDPIGFIKNLFTGVGKGLTGFIAKIGSYLSGGLKDWLLGKLAENGIAVPETWDLKGIFGLVTQVVGVTYQKIRTKVIERLGPKGEEMVAKMEGAIAFVKELITKGPIALWEKVQNSLGDIKDTIIGGIQSFIQERVIKEGITFLLGMLNPAGALIKAVQLLVRLINFLRENMARIASFVNSIFSSVVDIANGNLEGAAKTVEGALAKAVPILISFAARLLNLGNLAKKVQEIIKKIGKRVGEAVDKVIAWLVDKAKSLWKKVMGKLGLGKEKEDGEEVQKEGDGEIGKTVEFSADEENHKLWIDVKGKNVEVMVASTPTSLEVKLEKWRENINKLNAPPTESKARQLIAEATKLYYNTKGTADDALIAMDHSYGDNHPDKSNVIKYDDEVERLEDRLKIILIQLFDIFSDNDGGILEYIGDKVVDRGNEGKESLVIDNAQVEKIAQTGYVFSVEKERYSLSKKQGNNKDVPDVYLDKEGIIRIGTPNQLSEEEAIQKAREIEARIKSATIRINFKKGLKKFNVLAQHFEADIRMGQRYETLKSEFNTALESISLSPLSAFQELLIIEDRVTVLTGVLERSLNIQSKSQEHRLKSNNIAFGDYAITYYSQDNTTKKEIKDDFISVSGINDKTSLINHNFTTENVRIMGLTDSSNPFKLTVHRHNNEGKEEPANQDSERKLAEFLLKTLSKIRKECDNLSEEIIIGEKYSQFKGYISLNTEMHPCNSCDNIIMNMRQTLPNVNINMRYGVKYP